MRVPFLKPKEAKTHRQRQMETSSSLQTNTQTVPKAGRSELSLFADPSFVLTRAVFPEQLARRIILELENL